MIINSTKESISGNEGFFDKKWGLVVLGSVSIKLERGKGQKLLASRC